MSHYDTLSLPKTATIEDVKKAYKELAKKWHPDKHQDVDKKKIAESKFKTICAAYEILSDPAKKEQYDEYGNNNGELPDAYTNMFRTKTSSGGMFGQGPGFQSFSFNGNSFTFQQSSTNIGDLFGEATQTKAAPISYKIGCTLEELFSGCIKKRKLTKKITNVSGTVSEEEKILDIIVEPGYTNGTKITFTSEGNQSPDIIPADIVFIITETPHESFKREGANLIYFANLTLKQALIGGSLNIKMLDGSTLNVPYDGPLEPGSQKRIENQGMPDRKTKNRGDLFIRFGVVFPKTLTQNQKLILSNIL
jgi:DnaJ-class molecular chaperone